MYCSICGGGVSSGDGVFGGVAQIIVNLIEYIALAFLHKYFTSKENVNLPDLNRIVQPSFVFDDPLRPPIYAWPISTSKRSDPECCKILNDMTIYMCF